MRRVWIIAKKDKLEQKDFNEAAFNDCPEIANGIPPVLQDVLSESQLPFAYEEPELPLPIPPRDLEAEIDEIKAKIADYDDLKARVEKLEKLEKK